MQNKEKEQKALISKSFRFIFNKITKHLQAFDFKALNEFLKSDIDILKKVCMGLTYYRILPPDGAQRGQALMDPNNPKKWGGKDQLSMRLASNLVLKVSEVLCLDEVQTFDLLDGYFMTNDATRKHLMYLRTLDQQLTDLDNPQMIGQIALPQMFFHQRETCEKEMSRVIQDVISEVQVVFFQERSCLLQSILALLNASTEHNQLKEQILKDMLNTHKVHEKLVESLESNAKNVGIFSNMASQREIIINLQKEEILILQSLLKLYKKFEIPTVTNIIRYLNYALQNGFLGTKLPTHGYQADSIIQQQQKKITNLIVLQVLNIFQIHQFTVENPNQSETAKQFVKNLLSSNEYGQLQTLISDLRLDDITSVVYLAFRQVLQIIHKLDLPREYKLQGVTKDKITFNFDAKTREIIDQKFMDQILAMSETNKSFEEDLFDRKGELNLLIQDWINISYPFFKANRMDFEIELAQSITFEILKQPIHLKYIWQQIDKNQKDLFGQRVKENNGKKVIYHSLDIFENILENPFSETTKFITLMIALCGNKYHKYVQKVFLLLEKNKIDQIQGNHVNFPKGTSFIQCILGEFINKATLLDQRKLSSREFTEFSNICILLGKMISLDSDAYEGLNQESMELRYQVLEDKFNQCEGTPLHKYIADDPLLYFMILSMHSIVYWEAIEQAVYAFKHLLQGLTSIYKNLGYLRSKILYHLQTDMSASQVPIFIEFYKWYLDNNETQDHVYPITQTYLKFLDAVFRQSDPWKYLDFEGQKDFDVSILNEFLNQIYSPVLMNFTRLDFIDMKDFFKLYYRLLKLTNHLLEKYKDINPNMKAPLSQRFPQFDQMLRLVTEYLNQQNIEFLIINAILLQEDLINGQSTGFTNKFWVEQMKLGKPNDSRQRVRIQRMIKTALQGLNTLAELATYNQQMINLNPEQLIQVGARGYYISKLQCVQNVTTLLKNPSQWQPYPLQGISGVSYSVFNIVQYYVKPHLYLCPFISQIQIQALQFFVSCCKFWELLPIAQRVSLEFVLRTSGLTHRDIKYKYIINLTHCVKNLKLAMILQYLCQFFDLLIISTRTQTSFVEDLFRETQMENAIQELIRVDLPKIFKDEQYTETPVLKPLVHEVQSKCLILFSELSNHRVCEEFMKKLVLQNDFFDLLFKQIIKRNIEDLNKVPVIEYDGRDFEDQVGNNTAMKNEDRKINLFLSCSSIINIKYYLRLLQEEYSRNINNDNVRKAISNLFQISQLHTFAQRIPISEQFTEMLALNQILKTFDKRNFEYIREFIVNVNANQKLTAEQLNMLDSVTNRYVTDDSAPVFLNNLDAANLYQYLQRVPSHSLFSIQQLDLSKYGQIGTQFMINVDELLGVLLTYGYTDTNFLCEVKRVTSCYNMLLSYLFSYNQFTFAYRDFILSIGKTRMRENLRNKQIILNNLAFSTSMFDLIITDKFQNTITKLDTLKGTFNLLAKLIIEIARPLTRKIAGVDQLIGAMARQEQIEQDYGANITLVFEIAQNETELDLLSITLGILNSILEQETLPVESLNIVQNEIVNNLVKGLPKIRQNQTSQFSTRNQQSSLRLDNEKLASKLFINLALQTFSISSKVQEQMKRNKQQVVLYQNEIEYIQILSQVLRIIQDGTCFVEGIKILEQSFNLLQNEHLLQFMKKLDVPPLRIITQKFMSPITTYDENIKIIEFLTSYARIEDGAKHLFQENVLMSVSISSLISQVNQQEFYEVEGTEQKRSAIHILWCHFLLFLRTLNHHLFSELEYRKLIAQQITAFWPRFSQLLMFGARLKEQAFYHKSLSLALFEELELISGIIQQFFDYGDEFARQEYQKFAEVKDYLLFAVINFLSDDRGITYCSATEQYLNGLSLDQVQGQQVKQPADRVNYTGLDLVIQVQKIKVFQNLSSSILNLLLLNQEQNYEIINTWDSGEFRQKLQGLSKTASDRDYASQSNLSYLSMRYQGVDQQNGIRFLALALKNLIDSLTQMSRLYKQWIFQETNLEKLFKEVYDLFKYDEWIRDEYNGLNNFFAGLSFAEVLFNFEQSLQMGHLSALLMLQQLNNMQNERRDFLDVQIQDRDMIDFGDIIYRLYIDVCKDTRSSKVVKESAEISSQIKDYVERLKTDQRGSIY